MKIRFIQLFRYTVLVGLCLTVVSGTPGQGGRTECSNDIAFWTAMNQVSIEFSNGKERLPAITAWMAESPEQRKRGFQGACPRLVIERALLFAFPVPVYAKFHMTGVAVPLDIAFIDGSNQVINIQRMTKQELNQPITYYQPKAEIQFALETEAGRLDKLRLDPGFWRMQISHRKDR